MSHLNGVSRASRKKLLYLRGLSLVCCQRWILFWNWVSYTFLEAIQKSMEHLQLLIISKFFCGHIYNSFVLILKYKTPRTITKKIRKKCNNSSKKNNIIALLLNLTQNSHSQKRDIHACTEETFMENFDFKIFLRKVLLKTHIASCGYKKGSSKKG